MWYMGYMDAEVRRKEYNFCFITPTSCMIGTMTLDRVEEVLCWAVVSWLSGGPGAGRQGLKP
jgi:hypothetical protein